MHRLHRHENEHAPCNAYCVGDTHVDILYIADWLAAEAGSNLLGVIQRMWKRRGFDAEATVVALTPSPEAHAAQTYYPKSWRAHPEDDGQAYRVTYRLVRPQE